jgi:hypothetical protein
MKKVFHAGFLVLMACMTLAIVMTGAVCIVPNAAQAGEVVNYTGVGSDLKTAGFGGLIPFPAAYSRGQPVIHWPPETTYQSIIRLGE